MGKLSCFSGIVGRKKKDKGNKEDQDSNLEFDEPVQTLHVRIKHPVKSVNNDDISSTSFSVPVPFPLPSGNASCKVQVINYETPTKTEVEEVAYEGEDEHDEKKEYSDSEMLDTYNSLSTEKYEEEVEEGAASGELIKSGNLSDPGTAKAEFWSSPSLKRSCSNLELRHIIEKQSSTKSPALKVQTPGSPASVLTQVSADKVMLKKHSSSQILPSKSRRLWWKLFLWSHRNLHHKQQNLPPHPPRNQQGGYSSDTLEPNRFMELGKMGSPGSFTGSGFQCGSGLWPQNQWVAFPTESSSHHSTRVDDWVKELSTQQPSLLVGNDEEQNDDMPIVYPPSPSKGKSHAKATLNISDEIVHANNVIHSLNSSTTVAHVAGMGLKVIPTMSHLSSLRSVNLSSNYIVQITSGSLPKGLHTLNLSRNKISTIDGLRELTRLRVLDLSYNRISRIGQGLSNCTSIKELYLAGNKISFIEGLHRLLKLTVLELSFNKISTTKSLGQLVANYNSLLALNLLGNPIQSNINEEQLRKAVLGLLPKLAFLNKQAINTHKAREVATEAIARAAIGSSGWSSRGRKSGKRSGQSGSSSSVRGGGGNASVLHKSKHRLRSKSTHQSGLKSRPSSRV